MFRVGPARSGHGGNPTVAPFGRSESCRRRWKDDDCETHECQGVTGKLPVVRSLP
jgi:hypothetical protein